MNYSSLNDEWVACGMGESFNVWLMDELIKARSVVRHQASASAQLTHGEICHCENSCIETVRICKDCGRKLSPC